MTVCHLLYAPIGRSCSLPNLDYVQPKFLTIKSPSAMSSSTEPTPATIKPDNDDPDVSPTFISHWPKRPPSQHHSPLVHVFFPNFIMEVNTVMVCHLLYAPIGRSCSLPNLDYVQPKFLTIKSPLAMSSSTEPTPATIKPDDDDPDVSPTFVSHWPKRPPSQHHSPLDLSQLPPSTYTKNLKDLDRDKLIRRLYSIEIDNSSLDVSPPTGKPAAPLVCMEHDDIIAQLHYPDKTPPSVRPCDTPNPSDTKSTWTAEELHPIRLSAILKLQAPYPVVQRQYIC